MFKSDYSGNRTNILTEKSFGAFGVLEAIQNSLTSGTKHSLQSWANHFTWYFEGHNIRQESFILRLLGQAVWAQGILILVLSRNSEGGGQPVCRVAHSLTSGELSHCRELGKEPHRIRYAVNRCSTAPRVIWGSQSRPRWEKLSVSRASPRRAHKFKFSDHNLFFFFSILSK